MTDILSEIDKKIKLTVSSSQFEVAEKELLEDQQLVEFIYGRISIEGGSLARDEIAHIMQQQLTVGGKTIKEHLLVLLYEQAYHWIKQSASLQRLDINEEVIATLHSFPFSIEGWSTREQRGVSAYPYALTELVDWLHQQKGHPVQVAIDAFVKVLSTQPFSQDNERTAFLLLNVLLIQSAYPPIVLNEQDQQRYKTCVAEIEKSSQTTDIYTLIPEVINRAIDMKLAHENAEKKFSSAVLKIGQLAKITGESVPTIRYWTKQGLLVVIGSSTGGQKLYSPDQVSVVKTIRHLQTQGRYSLEEIKSKLRDVNSLSTN